MPRPPASPPRRHEMPDMPSGLVENLPEDGASQVEGDAQPLTSAQVKAGQRHRGWLPRLTTGTGAFNIIGPRRWYYIVSTALVVLSILFMVVRGFNLSIDFVGGTQITFTPTGTVQTTDVAAVVQNAHRRAGRPGGHRRQERPGQHALADPGADQRGLLRPDHHVPSDRAAIGLQRVGYLGERDLHQGADRGPGVPRRGRGVHLDPLRETCGRRCRRVRPARPGGHGRRLRAGRDSRSPRRP